MAISVKWRKNRAGNPAKLEIWEAGETIAAGDVLVPGDVGGGAADEAYLIDATGEKVLGVALNVATDGNDVAVVVAGRDDVFEFISSSSANFTKSTDVNQLCAMDTFTTAAMTANPSTAGNDIRMLGLVEDGDSDNDDATDGNHFLGVFANTYYED